MAQERWWQRLGWRDYLIAILLLGFAAFAVGPSVGRWLSQPLPPAGRETVEVVEVKLDRDDRRSLQIVFDRNVGELLDGEYLETPPATLSPAVGGTWRWTDDNVLAFEATVPLAIATEYRLELIPERLLTGAANKGRVFQGETSFSVVTDRFLLEKVEVFEEAVPGGGADVVLRGTLQFNYPVRPEELFPRLKLIDPAAAGPLEVPLETTYQNARIRFRTAPLAKSRKARKLRLTVAADLTSAEGNLPLGEEFVQTVPLGSKDRLEVRRVTVEPGEGESSLRLALSSPVRSESARGYLEVEPPLEVRVSSVRNDLLLEGPFRPGESYVLKLKAGLPAEDGASLPEPWQSKLSIPNLEPKADFQSQGMFLSASGFRHLAIESVNVPKVEVVVDRVYRNNLFSLLQFQGWNVWQEETYRGGRVQTSLGDRLAQRTLELPRERNRSHVTPVDLGDIIDGHTPGFYRVGLEHEGHWQSPQRWVLITDLGVVARRGEEDLLVWVSSFANLAPVAGARVRLLSDQNQILAEGRTDGAGLWHLEGLSSLLEAAASGEDERRPRPFLILVERAQDWSFLPFDQTRIDTTGLDVGGASLAGAGYNAFLYGERNLYRPGETVRGLAVVRDEALAPAPPMPAVLRHLDPEGRERGLQRLTLDTQGLAELTVQVPPYALTGNHVLDLRVADRSVGQYRFQVEEFVPDRIKVAIAPQAPAVLAERPLSYQVSSAYLFGAPAASLAVESRVRLVPRAFAPEGFEGFDFTLGTRSLTPREIFEESTSLDEDGLASFEVEIPAGLSVPSSLEAWVTARVQEQGGRGVAALDRVPVHPYPYYVGLRRLLEDGQERYPEPGQTVQLEYVAVSPGGQEAPAGALRMEIYRERWQTVLRRTGNGGYRYESSRESRLLEAQDLPGGASRGTFRFTPQERGSYRIVLTDPDTGAGADVELYASGWGYSPWAIKNPGRLELELEQEEYKPGETAYVQVKAPFSGRLLLTVERDRVYHQAVYQLEGNSARIPVPVRGDFRPNVYVTATLIRAAADLEPGTAGRAFGAVPLVVDRTANRLAVKIEAPAEVRPETELKVVVTGAAPGAAVTVAAVDEGILQLIAQKTPAPFEHFYRKLALGIGGFDIFSLLLPEVSPQRSPAGGGAGADGLAQFVRTEGLRRVEPVAFWSGLLTADAAGEAQASFRLPEFQGALRVMAVAAAGRRFGSAEHFTRVKSPVVILPTAPRFLGLGEIAVLPVTVRNDTGKAGRFEVRLATEGPVQLLGSDLQGEGSQAGEPGVRSLELESGREGTVHFRARSGAAPGAVNLRFSAAGNGERSQASIALASRADLPAVTEVQVGTLASVPEIFPAASGERFRPGTARRSLRLSRFPLVQFAGRLEYLLGYPYGCLEQTTSRAFPLIYLEELAAELAPAAFAELDTGTRIASAARRLYSMQLQGGGFGFWPGQREVQPWGSLYASHFLVEAQRAGHPVPVQQLDQALAWVGREVRVRPDVGFEALERSAYGLFVLARAGRADLGTMDFLRQRQMAKLEAPSKALLAAAYAGVGNRQAVEELLQGVQDLERVERQTGNNLRSIIRQRALLLLAMLDAAPGDPRVPALVERLSRDTNFTWWNTQETSFVLLALGQFFQRQAEAVPAGASAEVWAGDRQIGTFDGATVVFDDLAADEALEIRFDETSGAGQAYYQLSTRGIPTDAAFEPVSAGLEVKRELLGRDKSPLDLGSLEQGDLIVLRTRVRSVSGKVENVVVQSLLPAGLEVENPRLATTEAMPWITDANLQPDYLDLRDDRILVFTDLPDQSWRTFYTLARAVTPGTFRLPPVQAESMYDPSRRATGPRGELTIRIKR